MSLAYVLQQFDAIGPMGTRQSIKIDQSFIGSAEIAAMLRSALAVDSFTIDAVTNQITRADDRLQIVGATTINELKDAQVTFLARDRDGQLSVVLEIQLPAEWSFSNVLPDLPSTPGASLSLTWGSALPEPHFLSQLAMGAGRLIISSDAYFDERFSYNVLPGLNFVGELYPFAGALRSVGTFVESDSPVSLTGPLKEFRSTYDPMAFLGVRLTAPLDFGTSKLGPLTIRKSSVYLKAALDEHQRDPVASATQEPGIYLLVDAELGGRPLQMVGKHEFATMNNEVSLNGRFTDFAVSGIAGLSQTVGVDGFDSDMPSDFPAPEGLSLTEFGTSIDFTDLSVTSLTLGVGTKTNWELIPDVMSLRELGLTFFVQDPFQSTRSLTTTITGLLAFKKFSLAAFGELPTFRVGAGLPAGQTLPLGDVIESFLPAEANLPPLTITRLRVRATPKEKAFYLDAALEDLLSIPVGATAFEVSGLSVLVDYNKTRGRSRAILTAQMTMADALVALSGEFNNGLTLAGSLTNFELKKLWSLVTNGEELPEEFPDIIFDNLSVRVDTKTGAFSVLGDATVAWDHLTPEGSLSTNVQFSLNRNVSGGLDSKVSSFTASLSLQGTGPVNIADGFSLEAFNLLFNYQTNAGWQLSGGVGVDIFDTRLDLQAGYETSQAGQKIKLRATASPPAKLIDFPSVASYSFAQFDLLLDRRPTADGKKKTFFDLRLASTLAIDQVFSLGGYLSIIDTAEGRRGLLFKPNPGSTAFHINFPTGEGMGFTGDLFEVGFVKESATSGWTFTATTNLGFTGFPGVLGKMLPSKVTTKLVAGKTDVHISALNVSDPVDIALPTLQGKSLGQATVQLTEVGISIKPQLGLVLEAGLGLPAELNTFLGSQMFRVYQKGNPLSMARTRFTISGTGVAMQFVSSPFAAANTVMINGESWFDVDFGEYGALSLKMPTFVYDGVKQYFEAGGGIQIKRTLALPLAPLKLFLEAVAGKDAASIFPSKIPIESVHFFDKDGNLQIDGLVSFLKKAGDVPSEVISALKTTAKVLDRFPAGFKHYLNIDIPEHLEFRFGFSPTGRVTLGMLAPETPVRVLFPSVVQSYVPMPGLCGIEVRKFFVGTLLAGELFYGQVDAIIDQFDLPSLAVSLMLPRSEAFPLPTSDQLQRHIILDDVFCIIPVSEGLPIPLPVFYDEIGFEYLGVEGLGLQAHVGFPAPKVDGAAAMAIYKALSSFFSDRKALLDPKNPPGGVDLAFTFHDEFLQAPEYLGGGTLGTKGKSIKVSTWKYLASLLNFGKTFSINDCIGSIPIENRVGSAQYKFAFMSFDADWMLTTPAEFRSGAFQNLKLSASDVNDFMTVLPSVASSSGQGQPKNEEGLVTFVRGKADLAFIRLDAAFGLAASGSMGFNTGFKLEGAIGVTEIELSGAVMVNSPIATGVAAAPVLQAAVDTAKTPQGGHALSFNGKNSWIEIPAANSLVLPEYTIEIWLKSAKDQAAEWANVFGVDTRKGGLWRNHFLAVNAKNGFYHHRFTDAGGGNSGAPNTPNGTVRWDQWQHVALTNDGVTAKTYVDGKELASGPVNGALVTFKDTLWVGKVAAQDSFWKGEIAEIRIWKRARSASEIASQRYERISADSQDLVSLYRFEQDTGSRATDLCGRNHGTITNCRFVPSDLLLLSGLVFDGKDDYIEVPDSPSLRLGAYTVEAWIKPSKATHEWSGVFGKKGRNYALYLNNVGSYVHHRFHTAAGSNDGAPNTPGGTVAWNTWNHLAITNDGKIARTYVNGVKLAEGPVNGNLFIDNEKISFGRTADGNNAEFYDGELAEVRLWSRVRSPEELTGNMYRRLDGTDPSLVSLWRLSEATGETLLDVCNKNPGRIYMDDAAAPAKLQHDGLILDGKSDYALIAQSDKFNTGQYTIEAWVRPDRFPTGSWQCIWGGSGKAPKLYLSNKGIVSHRYVASIQFVEPSNLMKGKSPTIKKIEKAMVVNTDVGQIRFGEWNHIAVTNDGKQCTILVNGSGKGQDAVPGPISSEAASINVGRSGDASDQAFFCGGIDDLRYWSVARTPDQITSGMSLPLTGSEPGLVAYYNMDHTSGTQLVDLGPNKLDGVVNGGQWALAARPAAQGRAAIQLQGHAQLKVAGRQVMRGDLGLVDDQFWFSGQLDLFPKDWPIRVSGHVEGMVSKQRFYLNGETVNELFGFTLSQSRLFMSNDEIRLEGRWLGAYMLVDISWENNDPIFKGSAGFKAWPHLDFGSVRIGGVKVATNVSISIDLLADVSVVISRKGFSGDITAGFKINGKGFDLHLGIDIAPSDFDQLINWIKQQIIDAPEKYLAHLFSDAATWLKNVGEKTIEFMKDSGEAVGAVLSSAYKVSKEEAAKLMKNANYAADQVGNALKSAYSTSAEEAAKLLHNAGYTADQVGNALKSGWNCSADAVSKALKGANYAADEVGNTLKSAYGTSAEEAAKLLEGAGYTTDQVGSALKSGWNTSLDAVSKGAKKLDPTKW